VWGSVERRGEPVCSSCSRAITCKTCRHELAELGRYDHRDHGGRGCGKDTVGTKLASALHCEFLEGDSLHSKVNVEKMTRGVALTDIDRMPWLAAIRAHMQHASAAGRSLVVACSALKESYRTMLADGLPVTFVYLKGSPELIRSRLEHRSDHFMTAALLTSQFDALEEPSAAIVVDVDQPIDMIVNDILRRL